MSMLMLLSSSAFAQQTGDGSPGNPYPNMPAIAPIGVRIGKHLEVYGRVENLFDEKYMTVYGYGTYGRAAYGGIRVKLN